MADLGPAIRFLGINELNKDNLNLKNNSYTNNNNNIEYNNMYEDKNLFFGHFYNEKRNDNDTSSFSLCK